MIVNTLNQERVEWSFDQMRTKLKETLTESAAAAQQEEIQEDIRILKERIDTLCEKDIEPIRADVRMLFEYIVSMEGETPNPLSRREFLSYLRKRKNSVQTQYIQPS
jgi:hypothetical protein